MAQGRVPPYLFTDVALRTALPTLYLFINLTQPPLNIFVAYPILICYFTFHKLDCRFSKMSTRSPEGNLDVMAPLVLAAAWDDPLLLDAAIDLRRSLCDDECSDVCKSIVRWTAETVGNGVAMLCLVIANCTNRDVVYNTLWALTNFASESDSSQLLSQDVVPVLVRLLGCEDMEIVEQAGWALGNLAGDGVEPRNRIHDAGGVAAGIAALRNPKLSAAGRRNITWTMSNLCRGKPPPKPEQVGCLMDYFREVLCRLVECLQDDDRSQEAEGIEKESVDVLWGVSFLTDGSNAQVQLGIEVVPLVVALLSVPDEVVLRSEEGNVANAHLASVLEFLPKDDLGRLCTLSADMLTCCISSNRRLYNRLRTGVCHKQEIRVPAVRIIGNLMTGENTQVDTVIQCGGLRVIESLIPSLRPTGSRAGANECREVCWLLSNVAAGTVDQCRMVLRSNVFCMFLMDALGIRANVATGKEAGHVVCNALAILPSEVPVRLVVALFAFLSIHRCPLLDDALRSLFDVFPALQEGMTREIVMDPTDALFTTESLVALVDENHPQSLEYLGSLMLSRILPTLLVAGALEHYLDDNEWKSSVTFSNGIGSNDIAFSF